MNPYRRWLNRQFRAIELRSAADPEAPLRFPPVFIIGAPRSGSTLFYQVLSEYYDFGCLTNLHCKFFEGPSVVERLLHPSRRRTGSMYTSRHGVIRGLLSPSECGPFWYRFFRRSPQYVPMDDADPEKLRECRSAVRALGDAMDRPPLFKNMHCALRLRPLAHALPEAVFLIIQRDLVDNARSLLAVRREVCGDYATWWSMEPPEYDELIQLPVHEQVIEQVRRINALIQRDARAIGPERFLHLTYEDLCRDVKGTLTMVHDFLVRRDIAVAERDVNVPDCFEVSSGPPIDVALEEKVIEYAARK